MIGTSLWPDRMKQLLREPRVHSRAPSAALFTVRSGSQSRRPHLDCYAPLAAMPASLVRLQARHLRESNPSRDDDELRGLVTAGVREEILETVSIEKTIAANLHL